MQNKWRVLAKTIWNYRFRSSNAEGGSGMPPLTLCSWESSKFIAILVSRRLFTVPILIVDVLSV